ncbi:MAG: hypothetical protein E6G49_09535, partial [Actinobacteria bacterium]
MELACASCGAAHPIGARFCSSCGAPLQRTCPGCGSEQPATATFCSVCGMALRDDARRAPATAGDRQERRVVTVLFADLAGSTALGERLDPEEVRELQGELFAVVNSEVEKYGGTSEKFVGDAVLAVFGIPQAHEDDPERAVRAALAVQASFGSFSSRVRDRHGADVALRIGVNTGEVVAGREAAARGELMVSGDAVNVAARLQQSAEPGDVLVGQRTHSATYRAISFEPYGDVEAKGKQDPLSAWVAVSAAAEQEARPRGVAGLTAPMVGRDEELAVLTALAGRVERERAPQLITLFGPAGVGKSRLLAEIVERLPGSRLLKGRCLPYGEGVTYWPLAEAAKTHAGILETDSAEVALAKLRAAIEAVVPEEYVERVLEAAAWTTGFSLPNVVSVADPREIGRRLGDAWTRYIAALGREQLTVVAVEDVHWGSSALLDLLEQLAESLVDTRVLLVCTARLELLEVRPTWGAGKQNATTLSLAPLSPAESEELVVSLLGEAQVPGEVRGRILDSAEGNPFFLEEMLNMLIEEGALERQNGAWNSTERLANVSIPDSVHGVIAARIRVLEAAAWTTGFSLPNVVSVADPREIGRRLGDAWTRYIAALGREQLTVVAVEDVHWGSSALLDLLEQLAESLVDTRVLLVCTARLELLEVRPTWGAGKQNATTLSLAPLSPAESEELVVSLLGEAQVPDEVRGRILDSAEGNPFFLEEMLNMLIEEGALERQNGAWNSTERLANVSIPDSVHGVIAARIDLLEAAARDALRRCSVVGRVFWPAAVDVDEQVVAPLSRTGLISDQS